MSRLILVRHGESQWNLTNRFTGWVDVPLTQRGVEEALAVAEQLHDVRIDHAFTSKLQRAHAMLDIILSRQQKNTVFLHSGEAEERKYTCEHHSADTDILAHTLEVLNERYYGTLQGLNKEQVRLQYGEEVVKAWRRGYDVRPPEGESIQDVCQRVAPFITDQVVPMLRQGRNVIIASHGNTMRAILGHTEKIAHEHLSHVDLAPDESIIYNWRDEEFTRITKPLTFDRPFV